MNAYVAVVEEGVERLQGGADVVELDLLGVEAAAAGLDVVLEFLGAFAGAVAVFHGAGPDAACHSADHGVLRILLFSVPTQPVRFRGTSTRCFLRAVSFFRSICTYHYFSSVSRMLTNSYPTPQITYAKE